MAMYYYSGTDESGQACHGELEAVNQSHALEKLKERKINVGSLTPVETTKPVHWRSSLSASRDEGPMNGWAMIGVGMLLELVALLSMGMAVLAKWLVFMVVPAWILSVAGSIFILAGIIRWAVEGAMIRVEERPGGLHETLGKLYDLEKSSR